MRNLSQQSGKANKRAQRNDKIYQQTNKDQIKIDNMIHDLENINREVKLMLKIKL